MLLKTLREAFGNPDARVYVVTVEGDPFHEVARYVDSDVQVTQVDGQFYAATNGWINPVIATEITE